MPLPSTNLSSFNVESILVDDQILENQTVFINNGLIKSIEKQKKGNNSLTYCGILLPGFIDIQVNGGGDCLFNTSPTIKSIQAISKAHQQYGTTG